MQATPQGNQHLPKGTEKATSTQLPGSWRRGEGNPATARSLSNLIKSSSHADTRARGVHHPGDAHSRAGAAAGAPGRQALQELEQCIRRPR
jgi:hypothetical protein